MERLGAFSKFAIAANNEVTAHMDLGSWLILIITFGSSRLQRLVVL